MADKVAATFHGPQAYDAEASTLEVTEKRCLECGSTYTADAVMCEVCDSNGSDPYLLEGFHTTIAPLGYEDDDDFLVRGGSIDIYEYPVTNEED